MSCWRAGGLLGGWSVDHSSRGAPVRQPGRWRELGGAGGGGVSAYACGWCLRRTRVHGTCMCSSAPSPGLPAPCRVRSLPAVHIVVPGARAPVHQNDVKCDGLAVANVAESSLSSSCPGGWPGHRARPPEAASCCAYAYRHVCVPCAVAVFGLVAAAVLGWVATSCASRRLCEYTAWRLCV